MPVAMALIFGAMVLAMWLIGILWAIALLIPFYAHIGLAVYLVWRSKRKHAELAESLQREAERQCALGVTRSKEIGETPLGEKGRCVTSMRHAIHRRNNYPSSQSIFKPGKPQFVQSYGSIGVAYQRKRPRRNGHAEAALRFVPPGVSGTLKPNHLSGVRSLAWVSNFDLTTRWLTG